MACNEVGKEPVVPPSMTQILHWKMTSRSEGNRVDGKSQKSCGQVRALPLPKGAIFAVQDSSPSRALVVPSVNRG